MIFIKVFGGDWYYYLFYGGVYYKDGSRFFRYFKMLVYLRYCGWKYGGYFKF